MANEEDKPKIYYEEYFKTGIPYFEAKYIGRTDIDPRTKKPFLPHPMAIYGYEGLKNVGTYSKPKCILDPNFVLMVNPVTLMAKIPKTKKNLKMALEGSEWKEAKIVWGPGKDEDGNDARVELSRTYRTHKVPPIFKRVASTTSVDEQLAAMRKLIEEQMNAKGLDTQETDVVDTTVETPDTFIKDEEVVEANDSDAVDFPDANSEVVEVDLPEESGRKKRKRDRE